MKIIFSLLVFLSLNIKAATSLVTDQDYFPALMNELKQAQTSIDLMAFSFAIDDGKGNTQTGSPAFKVAELLANIKKEKGNKIQIRLFIEAERDTASRNKITAEYLSNAGVVVKYGSTHAKGFSIDHKKILFGSTNLTNQSMMNNNETNILSDDPQIINGFDQFYKNIWDGGQHGSLQLQTPMIADGGYKKYILNAINTAKKSLAFSIYYFNDADIERALIEAATKRGITIRGYINQHKTFALDLVEKNRQTIKRLREAGLKDLHFDLDNMFTHSKYIIRDQEEIILGTGNWNYSDVETYRQLYVQLLNPQLASALSQHLDEQIRTKSDPSK